MSQPEPGSIWKHYKGKSYRIIGVGRHSETEEVLVIYQALYFSEKYGDASIWVRPLSMWNEIVEHNGSKTPRFTRIG